MVVVTPSLSARIRITLVSVILVLLVTTDRVMRNAMMSTNAKTTTVAVMSSRIVSTLWAAFHVVLVHRITLVPVCLVVLLPSPKSMFESSTINFTAKSVSNVHLVVNSLLSSRRQHTAVLIILLRIWIIERQLRTLVLPTKLVSSMEKACSLLWPASMERLASSQFTISALLGRMFSQL